MNNDIKRVRALLGGVPDPGALPSSPAAHAAEVDAMLDRLLRDPGAAKAPVSQGPSRALPWLRPVAMAACVSMVVLATTGLPGGSSTDATALPIRPAVVLRTGLATEPARLLRTAAAAADRQPSSVVPANAVRYQRIMAGYLRTAGGKRPASVLATETTEQWVTPEGSGQIRHQAHAPIWPSAADRRAWEAAGLGSALDSRTDRFDHGLTSEVAGYSRDLDGLAARLRALPEIRKAGDPAAQMFVKIHELLRDPSTSPALTAALYRVAADLSGLRTFGAVRDQVGRPGVAVGLDSRFGGKLTRYELIIDPRTGALLEYQELLLERVSFLQAPPPVQIEFEIIADRSAAPAVGEQPAAPAEPSRTG